MTRQKLSTALAFAAFVAAPLCARAENDTESKGRQIDTEHLFGFNVGSDVGDVGDREIENQLDGGFGKGVGSYTSWSPMLGYEWVPVKNLRLEVTAAASYFDIAGVTGLDDRQQGGFQGLAFEMRYRLLDREQSGIGLAIDAEPHWGRVDEMSGAPVDLYGVDLAVYADTELVKDRIIGVFNLLYQPEAERARVTGEWLRESTLGASVGLMMHVDRGMFFGAEARYLQRYDGLGVDQFAGHGLFVGPMMFAQLTEHWWMSAAISVQVAGRAIDDPAPLDLTDFDRVQTRFRLGYSF
jgi:hypothetical protein